MTTLKIKQFAHIEDVSLTFADLTVLVGPQGTGKSLAAQWLKAILDGKHIVKALKDAGHDASPEQLVDQIFGSGMGQAWRPTETFVSLDDQQVTLKSLGRRGKQAESVFFIPAHRSMLIADGWAVPFQKHSSETPVVARLFSDNLFRRFTSRGEGNLFPKSGLLKKDYRDLIDDAIFHGGSVGMEMDQQKRKELRLSHGQIKLPFMTWTAGQREFTPLLLGLYRLLPSKKIRKQPEIDWVIIEEPEMGLHPKAISVFVLLVLDLLWRGYKVVLTTHSPTILAAVWMLRRLKEAGASWSLVCDAFDIKNKAPMKDVASSALTMTNATYYLSFGQNQKITSKDISSLDPGDDDDDISGWGGLSGFSSRYGEVVRKAVNAKD